MKNWERYETKIKEIGLAHFAVKESGEAVECANITCGECKFWARGKCWPEMTEWLYEDCEESKLKLTKEENAFLRALEFKDSHIARNESGRLFFFSAKPRRGGSQWLPISEYSAVIGIRDELFPFITWKSGKAWSIDELEKLEVED